MFTFRPLPELEAQLDYLSKAEGKSKNDIMNAALAQYLKTEDLRRMPLEERVIETEYDRYLRESEEDREQYKHAHEIANWVNTNFVWTAKPGMSHGELTPAIYGRNIVVGFTDSFRPNGKDFDRKLYVISKNLGHVGMGTESHHMYVTLYENWIKFMFPVRQLR